ncbi:SiaB family protein kinase [Zavarzinia sp. CC-PAN008]|uniref:SiaB family protein kinase n=1 Tax=Zavarzinia sp. CC-PAN008 TaxID=3243332 RepID=UPI003F749DA2
MLAPEYLSFRSALHDQGVIFCFTGYLSEGVLFALGEALKQKLTLADADANVTKRVFSVFVEQVQNVIRYSSDRVGGAPEPVELSSGLIAVGAEQQRFFVVCGNTVSNGEVPRLKDRLGVLQGLDKEAIRTLYRQKLREPPEEDSKGATIGLIEIARRASEPLQFDFTPLDANSSFFCLKVFI